MTIQFNGILRALVAAIILAALSTLGDFLWAHHAIKHRMSAGIIHGALLCLCLGVVLGYGGKTMHNRSCWAHSVASPSAYCPPVDITSCARSFALTQ